MQTYNIKFNYVTPLLMKSTTGVNPLHPLSKQLKDITSKRKKTEEDIEQMMYLDYQLGAYYDEEVGMYLPAEMIEASIREGAKTNRLGEKTKIAVFVNEDKIKLEHDGPKTIEELYALNEFKDVRVVTVNNSKILRCRPRFNRWAIDFTLNFDETIMDPAQLVTAIDIAGKQKGLGDYRPRYGRFAAKIEQIA